MKECLIIALQSPAKDEGLGIGAEGSAQEPTVAGTAPEGHPMFELTPHIATSQLILRHR